ncbi:MAG: tRNA (adenosine(37)-N6)-threonylcarbamoyltransferase complex ATPase subunit type 1 TsaE [Aquirufa sp.]
MLKSWPSYNLDQIHQVVKELLMTKNELHTIWLFRGQMGAGKTTLIKEICQQLGVNHHVQSPTFSLVNEYLTKHGETIYHFDLYRLKNVQEALEIGIEEYLDSGNICLIEWPEQAEELWDIPHTNFIIEAIDQSHRKLALECQE